MTIETTKERRKELGYSYQQLSDISGVPVGTIQKIFRGETTSPRYATVRALESALEESLSPMPLKEALAYHAGGIKKQGEYTVKDIEVLPQDVRAQLIDGVIYDIASPTQAHQIISGEVHPQIPNSILDRRCKCIPYIAPMDVQLDCDDKTMLERDVMIVCNRDRQDRKRVYGAPDFVMEVISPSTRKKDYYIKQQKYMDAGVREYWIIDPEQKVVIVHFFESEVGPQIYPLYDPVPVNIYNGELVIDLSIIRHWLEEE